MGDWGAPLRQSPIGNRRSSNRQSSIVNPLIFNLQSPICNFRAPCVIRSRPGAPAIGFPASEDQGVAVAPAGLQQRASPRFRPGASFGRAAASFRYQDGADLDVSAEHRVARLINETVDGMRATPEGPV